MSETANVGLNGAGSGVWSVGTQPPARAEDMTANPSESHGVPKGLVRIHVIPGKQQSRQTMPGGSALFNEFRPKKKGRVGGGLRVGRLALVVLGTGRIGSRQAARRGSAGISYAVGLVEVEPFVLRLERVHVRRCVAEMRSPEDP